MIADCVKEHQHNMVKITRQYISGKADHENDDICYQVIFGQVYTGSKPMMKDPKTNAMYPYFPHEARIRNMTYQIDSKVDVHIEKRKRNGNVSGEIIEEYKTEQIELCKIPVMIRSSQCHLNDENDKGIIR